MIRGLYTSASGMLAGQRRMDVTAHNIANVSTTGYKRQTAHFAPYLETALIRQDETVRGLGASHHGVHLTDLRTDTTDGPLEYTGRAADLAVLGGGFFCVGNEAGEVLYTRAGVFAKDAEGYLTTGSGQRLLGEDGPVNVGSGPYAIDADGRVYADGEETDRLRIAFFEDAAALRREGASLFSLPEGVQERAEDGPVFVRQGYLEGSNVNLATEMVEMIIAARTYAANQRLVSTHDSLLEKAVNQVGLVR